MRSPRSFLASSLFPCCVCPALLSCSAVLLCPAWRCPPLFCGEKVLMWQLRGPERACASSIVCSSRNASQQVARQGSYGAKRKIYIAFRLVRANARTCNRRTDASTELTCGTGIRATTPKHCDRAFYIPQTWPCLQTTAGSIPTWRRWYE